MTENYFEANFGGEEDGDWSHTFWSNWEDDFDFTDPEWYLDITEDFDFLTIFIHEEEVEGVMFYCDDNYFCWRHDEETGLYCEMYGECYDFDVAIEKYFGEGHWSAWEP